MKIVIDMNLSPEWVSVFEAAGYQAVHWSSVGDSEVPIDKSRASCFPPMPLLIQD